jgi:hypothetical protein
MKHIGKHQRESKQNSDKNGKCPTQMWNKNSNSKVADLN